jgi:hypothetical protein
LAKVEKSKKKKRKKKEKGQCRRKWLDTATWCRRLLYFPQDLGDSWEDSAKKDQPQVPSGHK